MVVSVNSSVLEKIRNKEYISKDLFNKSDKNIIPYNFNLDLYNDNILNKNIIKYNDYFESLKLSKKNNITLDNNQKKVVLADEDYLLVLAGAGTGKRSAGDAVFLFPPGSEDSGEGGSGVRPDGV